MLWNWPPATGSSSATIRGTGAAGAHLYVKHGEATIVLVDQHLGQTNHTKLGNDNNPTEPFQIALVYSAAEIEMAGGRTPI